MYKLCQIDIRNREKIYKQIDLLIIGDFKENFFERIGKILDLTDLPVEPLVYTEEEFKKLLEEENPFIVEVLKTGKLLYKS